MLCLLFCVWLYTAVRGARQGEVLPVNKSGGGGSLRDVDLGFCGWVGNFRIEKQNVRGVVGSGTCIKIGGEKKKKNQPHFKPTIVCSLKGKNNNSLHPGVITLKPGRRCWLSPFFIFVVCYVSVCLPTTKPYAVPHPPNHSSRCARCRDGRRAREAIKTTANPTT